MDRVYFLLILLPLMLVMSGCNGFLGKIKGSAQVASSVPVETYTTNFSAPDVIEGNALSFSFTLSRPLTTAVDFEYSISGIGAATEFAAVSGVVSLPAGANGGTITVLTNDNAVYDLFRDFGITVMAQMPDADARTDLFRIIDNESVPVVSFAASSLNVNENANLPSISLTVTPASKFPVRVSYLVGGTAGNGGVDHSMAAGTISIPALSASVPVALSLVDDAIVEGPETLILTLDSVISGAATLTGTNAVTVSIVDNEGVNLVIDDVTVGEGGAATFTVSLSAASAVNVTFDWATADGTGTSVSDYVTASGTGATITAGSLSTTITVNARNDVTVCEVAKTFLVNIFNVTIATVADGTGTGTVTDNDVPEVSFSAATSSVAEGTATAGTQNVTASLSAVCGSSEVTFKAVSAGVTATSGTDFTAISLTTFTIPAGSASVNIPVSTIADAMFENDESLTLTMSAPTGALLGAQTAHTLTITNDDARPTLTINNVALNEGTAGTTQNVTLTVTQSAVSGLETQVDYATADGTAVQPGDYTSTTGTLSIPAGSTSASITVPILRDALNEANETFDVNLSGGNGNYLVAGSDLSGRVTINNDDDRPTISIGAATAVTEGNALSFTVSITPVSGRDITFDFNTSDGTAIAGSDYTARSQSYTISAGSTSQVITVNTTDDAVNCEASETVNVALSNIVNASAATITRVATISENDIPAVSINSPTVTEGDSFNITLNSDITCTSPIAVRYQTYPSVAIAGQDYTHQEGTLTIAVGATTSNTVTVNTLEDDFPETDEYMVVGLDTPTVGTISTKGVAVLIEDDEATTGIAKVRMGRLQTCALSNTGDINCWGWKFNGGLQQQSYVGDAPGEMGDNLLPVAITASTPVQVAMGDAFTCVRYSNGGVKCFGSNDLGQLGQNHRRRIGALDELLTLPSINLGAGRTATQICTGSYTACALLDNGAVKCWGDSLVNGTNTNQGDSEGEINALQPISFAGGVTATKLTCGGNHSCIISSANDIRCWGNGSNGRLGNTATTNITTNVPAVPLGAGLTPIEVSAGAEHTCAILRTAGNEDKIKCWGDGSAGALGYENPNTLGDDSDEMGDNLPFVSFGAFTENAVKVYTAYDVTCAKFSSGAVKCWGQGGYNGTNSTLGDQAGEITGLANLSFTGYTILDLTVSYRLICARLRDDGTLAVSMRCIGTNANGVLGRENTTSGITTATSSAVIFGTGVSLVSLAVPGSDGGHNCAVVNNNGTQQVQCWGASTSGQLGNGKIYIGDEAGEMGVSLPVMTMGMHLGNPLTAIDISVGFGHFCALSRDGFVKCFGNGSSGQLGLSGTGSWGDGLVGGVPETLANQSVVPLPRPAIQVLAAGNNSCALLDDFKLYCWGEGRYGFLGQGNTTSFYSPPAVAINLGTNVSAMYISGGEDQICTILNTAAVKCWGQGGQGSLGAGFNDTTQIGDSAGELAAHPTVNLGTDPSGVTYKVKALAVSDKEPNHVCVILHDDKIKCWGYGAFGQLGINSGSSRGTSATPVSTTPTAILTGTPIKLTLGSLASCAVLSDLSLRCWGSNATGALGYGDTTTRGSNGAANSMALVTKVNLGMNGATDITVVDIAMAGGEFGPKTCVLLSSGELKCWGENFVGELGYGDRSNRGDVAGEVPVLLPSLDLSI